MTKWVWMVLVSINCYSGQAQSPQWWSDNVGWDGSRPHHYYINLSSEGMGPFALPVPPMHKMHLDTTSWISGQALTAYHPQEWTVASRLALHWRPSSWVRLMINVIPLEYYQTSHSLKTKRKIFYQSYYDKFAGGDFHIESMFRLPKKWLGGLRSELRIGLRAPSGTDLGAARYTDTPGYHFDLAVSKNIANRHVMEAMVGFLAYQTYQDLSRQNDCVLWGISHGLNYPRISVIQSFRGYIGYLRNGDAPMVYEIEAAFQPQGKWSWRLQTTIGLNDYPFITAGVACFWKFHLPFAGSNDEGEDQR